jgi:hypothetical protein
LLLFALALAKALMESNSCPSPPPAPPSLTFSDLPPPTCGRGSYEMANVYAGNAQLAVNSIVCAMGSYLLVAYSTTDLLDDDDAGRRHRAAAATASTLTQPMLSDAQHPVNVDPLPAWRPVTGAEAPVQTRFRGALATSSWDMGCAASVPSPPPQSEPTVQSPAPTPVDVPSGVQMGAKVLHSGVEYTVQYVSSKNLLDLKSSSGDILYGVAKDDVTAVNPEPAETS